MLGVPIAKLLAEAAKTARGSELMLNSKVVSSGGGQQQGHIGVEIDLTEVVESDCFRNKPHNEQVSWLKQFCRVFKGHVASADGLGGMVETNAVVSSAVRAMVAHVRVSVCPDDKVRSDVGGSYGTHYELIFDAVSLPRSL